MPVLAITTFQANVNQLISENLQECNRKAAENLVTTRLTRLTGRLKSQDNYFDKAGQNLYKDVSS